MIITLLGLVDPSAFKRFDIVVVNAAVDAIKQLKLDDQFNISFFTITRVPDDPDNAMFIAQIHKIADTDGYAYVGNVRFSIDERLVVFEAKAGCLLGRRNAIKEARGAVAIRARRFMRRY